MPIKVEQAFLLSFITHFFILFTTTTTATTHRHHKHSPAMKPFIYSNEGTNFYFADSKLLRP